MRRRTGCSVTPVSSRKTMLQPSLWAFLYGGSLPGATFGWPTHPVAAPGAPASDTSSPSPVTPARHGPDGRRHRSVPRSLRPPGAGPTAPYCSRAGGRLAATVGPAPPVAPRSAWATCRRGTWPPGPPSSWARFHRLTEARVVPRAQATWACLMPSRNRAMADRRCCFSSAAVPLGLMDHLLSTESGRNTGRMGYATLRIRGSINRINSSAIGKHRHSMP